LQNLYVQREGEPGLQSAFAGIIEMYDGAPVVAAVREVPVTGNETDALRAVALQVDLVNGRRDLLLADGRPEKLRSLPGGLAFQGEFGIVKSDAQGLVAATLVGGGRLQSGEVRIDAAQAAHSGRVVAVDYTARTATIEGLGDIDPAVLVGRSMEVGDGTITAQQVGDHTTSYTISGAMREGNRVLLSFQEGMDYYSSPVEAVDAAAGVVVSRLGLNTDDSVVYPGLSKNLVASNAARTKFWRAEFQGGTREEGYRFKLTGAPVTKADFGPEGVLRLWEFGVGDSLRIPTVVAVTRNAQGGYDLQSDTPATVTVGKGKPVKLDGRASR
jgi:hypothetical protein